MMGKCVSHENNLPNISMKATGGLWDYTNTWSESTKSDNAGMRGKANKNKGILYMTPIKYRPEEINEKQTFGHLESDSVIYSETIGVFIGAIRAFDPTCAVSSGRK